jgi:siroheme synthase
LSTLAAAVSAAGLESPALLIVGEVVGLQHSLNWFGSAPPVEASRSA